MHDKRKFWTSLMIKAATSAWWKPYWWWQQCLPEPVLSLYRCLWLFHKGFCFVMTAKNWVDSVVMLVSVIKKISELKRKSDRSFWAISDKWPKCLSEKKSLACTLWFVNTVAVAWTRWNIKPCYTMCRQSSYDFDRNSFLDFRALASARK